MKDIFFDLGWQPKKLDVKFTMKVEITELGQTCWWEIFGAVATEFYNFRDFSF